MQLATFSFRRLLSFVGPGFLVSIAYLDPGNIEVDLQSGTDVGYKLLWVVLWSTVCGLFIQRIAARIGVVTGYQMSELCHQIYPMVPRILLWVMMEIAVIASNIQEVIGTTIAINILSNKKIPLYEGVLISLLNTLTILLLDVFGLRYLEYFFAILLAAMVGTFGYVYGLTRPDHVSVVKGLFIPYCSGCTSNNGLKWGLGILASSITPHNLYLHSSLVKTRNVHSRDEEKIREASLYSVIDTGFSLFVSLIINLFVMSIFAKGVFNRTNLSVHNLCAARNNTDIDRFPNNNDTITNMNIHRAGVYLNCAYGDIALYIWAIGVLLVGQSSTITGTYSGQVIMEGFLNLKWKLWKRVLVTRTLAVFPTVFLAFYTDIKDLTKFNDDMDVLKAIQLPFALIPALTLSNSKYVMRQFRNGRLSKIVLSLISLIFIVANYYSVGLYAWENLVHRWWVWVFLAIIILPYIGLIIYLLLFQFALEGFDNCFTQSVLNPRNNMLWFTIRAGGDIPPPSLTTDNQPAPSKASES